MNRRLMVGLAGLLAVLVVVGAVSANGGGPAVDWWVISGGGWAVER